MAATTPKLENNLVVRVARLFANAGLIEPDAWNAHKQKSQKYRNIGEVLTSDVSLGAVRDLFMKAEINPFKMGRSTDQLNIGAQLMGTLDLSPSDLIDILRTHQTPIDRLATVLDEEGMMDSSVTRSRFAQAKELGEEPDPWLLRNEMLRAEMVLKLIERETASIALACRLYLSLTILNHNLILPVEDYDRLIQRLARDEQNRVALEEIQTEARKAIPISSAELLRRLEKGFFLQEIRLSDLSIEPPLLAQLPGNFAHQNVVLPFAMDERTLAVATDDPLEMNLAVLVRWLTGKWLRPYFAPTSVLQDKIQECYPTHAPEGSSDGANGTSKGAETASPVVVRAAALKSKKAASQIAATPPISRIADTPVAAQTPVDSTSAVKLINTLFERALQLNATDIHLEPRRELTVVRFRIDGLLRRVVELPPNVMGSAISRIKVLANMDVTERRRPQDGHITLKIGERNFDFRIASLPSAFGEKIAIRILDSARVLTGLKETGMNKQQHEVAERLIRQPYGIILVTGPTGSGKTSTLYAALSELNSDERHVVTIEDPIEYQLDGINQVQVDPNIDLTFSEGLRAILRQDPNVIMVGEIRDPDTAHTAIRAALTGHLVFSTLHTNSAIGAFQALANLGTTPYMIGSAVSGVIAQRLVRKLCPKCRKLKPVSKALAMQLKVKFSTKLKWHRPEGCTACLGSGYAGRVGIFEIIEMTDSIRRAVLENVSPSELLDIADEDGRISIRMAGLEKVEAGITSPEEIVEKVMLS